MAQYFTAGLSAGRGTPEKARFPAVSPRLPRVGFFRQGRPFARLRPGRAEKAGFFTVSDIP